VDRIAEFVLDVADEEGRVVEALGTHPDVFGRAGKGSWESKRASVNHGLRAGEDGRGRMGVATKT